MCPQNGGVRIVLAVAPCGSTQNLTGANNLIKNRPDPTPHFSQKSTFLLAFQKKCLARSQVCRTALIPSTLEMSDPGAINGWVRLRKPTAWSRFRHFWNHREPCNFWRDFNQLISNCLAARPLQKWRGRSQVVVFERLTHRWMRQGQSSAAHFESASYDTPESARNTFSEMGAQNAGLGWYHRTFWTVCECAKGSKKKITWT